jgi:hypothetical protein
METPELKPCPQCGSLDCGTLRCRFTMLEHSKVNHPCLAPFDLFGEIQRATQAFYPKEPSYWDEKAKDRREEFKHSDACSKAGVAE